MQTTDTRTVNGAPVTSTTTTNLSQAVTVTAVAERIGVDSNTDGTPDLTMNASFNYSTAGAEDGWFALWPPTVSTSARPGRTRMPTAANAPSRWSRPSLRRFGDRIAVPVYAGWRDDHADLHRYPLQIPMDALGTVLLKAAPNVAGSFEIQVQALTIDTDPNGGAPVQAISGRRR